MYKSINSKLRITNFKLLIIFCINKYKYNNPKSFVNIQFVETELIRSLHYYTMG